MRMNLAEYLGRRLRQAGVEHLFGVPGDFNLTLLDHLNEVEGLAWVGSPNELGAGYAADAYARTRGLAALVTTYGVGELSCINAVAGSAAEDVPVVHVVGSPRTAAVQAGRLVHHTLADGVFDRFEHAYRQISVAVETVTAERATEQIDAVLLAAITHRKPAYLSIPQDLATLPVDPAPLATPLTPVRDEAAALRLREALAHLFEDAVRPVLVVGHLVARFGLGAQVLQAARSAGIPIVTTLAAKGVIDESDPLNHGVYAGTMVDARSAQLVAQADLVLELGTVASDVLSGFFTHRPADERTLQVHATFSRIGETSYPVHFADAVQELAALCSGVDFERAATPVNVLLPDHEDEDLTQENLWRAVQSWLPEGTALLADTGTAFWGAASLTFPDDTVFHAQPIWNSIGYALPATLGQGLADPSRRPVLLIGDGAAQMTVQELSTIARYGLNPVILLLNNAGYTIERALQSPKAGYNDVAPWNWTALAESLVQTPIHTRTVKTTTELRAALEEAPSDQMVLIEAVLDPFDAPPLLRRLAELNNAGAE
ncbi:thiamine pyrophosphate-dependent enzyme [Kineosporia rhizophila]|uniref:alpha-keto acid decarboxylase family protein n=1 Tax=Kineosporia rhizophila TaxID=84633 RepID=UPI001E581627|nr:thiamine pyrophosphate-binding protein [Kineosporia rhizophila]MCE0536162.1 thiamine pyrophosphate-dependent enzyme [Kineosporia rhizophila]